MRVPGLDFKDAMGRKTLSLITTSGDRTKAQPMIDSVALCAQFLSMTWGGALWGKGGPPGRRAGRCAGGGGGQPLLGYARCGLISAVQRSTLGQNAQPLMQRQTAVGQGRGARQHAI